MAIAWGLVIALVGGLTIVAGALITITT